MNWRNLAFWVMMAIIVFLSFYIIHFVKTESYECMNNPGSYFINLSNKASNGETTCSCWSFVNESHSYRFTLNEKGIVITP